MYKPINNFRSQLQLVIILICCTFLSSCCGCRTQDGGTQCITVNGTNVIAYNNEDSTERVIYDAEPVFGDALMLRATIKKSTDLCFNTPKSNPFFPTAYATSCKFDETYKYTDSIIHVYISADKAYDDRNPAGAELNEFFAMPYTLELNEKSVFDIYAIRKPKNSDTYVYTINILLTDGRYIQASTSPVNVEN